MGFCIVHGRHRSDILLLCVWLQVGEFLALEHGTEFVGYTRIQVRAIPVSSWSRTVDTCRFVKFKLPEHWVIAFNAAPA